MLAAAGKTGKQALWAACGEDEEIVCRMRPRRRRRREDNVSGTWGLALHVEAGEVSILSLQCRGAYIEEYTVWGRCGCRRRQRPAMWLSGWQAR